MLNNRLLSLRSEKCATQSDVAKAIGISYISIGNYENGTRIPNADVLIKLANYFDVSADYLLGITEYRNQSHEDSLNGLMKSFSDKLDKLNPTEREYILSAINTTIGTITETTPDESELLTRLSGVISAYGDMIFKTWKITNVSKDIPYDYVLFLKHYEHCIGLINKHRESLSDKMQDSLKSLDNPER